MNKKSDDKEVKIPKEQELTVDNVTKYKAAADITNAAIEYVMTLCIENASVHEICKLGDDFITLETSKIYNKKQKVVLKGIAFPCALSLNNTICHFSPIASDPEILLKFDDIVKIQIGAHIDGFSAQVAHTIVVGASVDAPVTGRKADTIMAAHYCVEAAMRTLVPGNTNWQVTEIIQKICKDFNCSGVEGMLSHQVAKNVMDGEKTFVLNPNEQHRKEVGNFTFEQGEAYALEVLISSGEGKARTLETRTTIFKRNLDVNYPLKMKASRAILAEINTSFGGMSFSLRQTKDEKAARMGLQECVNHDLVMPYTVLHEKDDQIVAQFMYTILLTPNGTSKLTGVKFDEGLVKSEMKLVNADVIALLETDVLSKRSKK